MPRADGCIALHVLDAKHRRDPSRPHDDGLPLDALAELWFHYGDGLGDRDTGLPLVDSVWMLYPGSRPRVVPRVPAMATPDWPVDRLRGGTVSLVPDAGDDAGRVLDTVLGWVLG